jgi:predicted DsbA family dithiol-disulfide isomerase
MKKIRIDFVSDVACPWCAVGLGSLEQAIHELKEEITVDLQFHPFELNPGMPKGGQDTIEHLMKKYGLTQEQVIANQQQIQQRAEQSGFPFNEKIRPRVYNTFTCHRLLHWALVEFGEIDQYHLKRELLNSYFTLNENLDETQTLLGAIERASLPVEEAKRIIDTDEYSAEVKESLLQSQELGISAVPSVIVNQKYLIQGGQSAEVFVNALRQISNDQPSHYSETSH